MSFLGGSAERKARYGALLKSRSLLRLAGVRQRVGKSGSGLDKSHQERRQSS